MEVDDMYNVSLLSWVGTLDISSLGLYIIWHCCQGPKKSAYLTQWTYIVHVINSNEGHAIYSVTSY